MRLGSGLTVLLLAASSALAAEAVDGVNGKLDYSGGSLNSAEGHVVSGSLSVPLTSQFGFQADALYSRITDLDFYGGAGHLFWRDPNVGLAGLAGGYLYRRGVYTFQAGAEGEYYLNRFTFGVFGGAGSIQYADPVPFIDTNPTRFIGRVSVGYYPIDDLLVSASFTTAFKDNLVRGGLEYQTPIRGLALTAEAAYGDYGYDHLLFGVRYYFGANKSLRERQRQDDPPGLMQQLLYGLGVYGAEYNRAGRRYLAEHPGASGSSGSYGVATGVATLPPGDRSVWATAPPGTRERLQDILQGLQTELPSQPQAPLPTRPPPPDQRILPPQR